MSCELRYTPVDAIDPSACNSTSVYVSALIFSIPSGNDGDSATATDAGRSTQPAVFSGAAAGFATGREVGALAGARSAAAGRVLQQNKAHAQSKRRNSRPIVFKRMKFSFCRCGFCKCFADNK